ncbi:MAG: PAS domain S-box protein [Methanospirillum sp.]|uniref:hybrid sensor histidine kinase/response regulator n=1 Tax=Methanospirillum sp. TaxID=45200 RepID=UPI00236E0C58|nr:PAS domain S-box protein [Methanospirillum sp.]MDD1727653.1 PAS domain S-box protein [Methanospirillum sp.]
MPEVGLSILYVDDEILLLEITSQFLSSLGFQVDTSESGIDALNKIGSHQYDAIVSDYQMPDMDGITLLKEIRKEYPNLPFILFTGRGREEVVIQAIENGADFYLQKGGSPRPQYTELAHKIRTAVHQRRDQAALRESEIRFNQVMENAGEWVWDIDADGMYRYCNSAVERILGYTPEELVGLKHFYDLYDPRMQEEQTIQAMETILERRTIQERIFYFFHKNGTQVILQSSGSPIFDTNGDFRGFRGVHMDVTASRKSQDLIKRHEQRLVRAQEIGKTGSWEYDIQVNLLWGSEGALRIFGYSRPAGSITIEEIESCIIERERVHQALIDLITTGAPYNIEYTINPADGTPQKILSSIASLEPDDQGNVKVIGVIVDITERKKAEDEIRRMNEDISAAYEELVSSEEELRINFEKLAESQQALQERDNQNQMLIRKMPIPIGVSTASGKIRFVNDRFTEVFGYRRDDTPTIQDWAEHAYPDEAYRQEVNSTWMADVASAAEENREILPREYQVTCKNGEIKTVQITGIHIGEYLMTTFLDVTDQNRAIAALTESEEKYQILFELGSEAIFLIDNETGALLESNSEATEIYGYTHEELMQMRNVDLSAEPDDTNRITAETTTKSVVVPLRFHRRKSGEVFPVEITGRFFTWKGRSVHVAAIRDITERKRAEDALLQANRQLGLLSTITRHDILNMITVIFGYLDVIEEQNTDPEIREYCTKLESAIRMVQAQIEFTRIYQNLGATRPIWISLCQVMPDSFVPASISLVTDPGDLEIYADPMLGKVFSNLVDNTVRYGKGATTIRITTQISDTDLIIVYEDDGIGIAEPEKELIFERGYGKNTGLGLFLVREILAITAITIVETGVQGAGARFELTVSQGTYRHRSN